MPSKRNMWFLGFLGMYRFYVGKVGAGILLINDKGKK